MFIKSTLKYFTLGLIGVGLAWQTAAAAPMRLSMLLEHESFLMWYAKEHNWDKDLGLDLELQIFNTSGADLLQKQRDDPEGWDVTSVGAVPATIYSKNMQLSVFALANNESRATEIFVRADSDILKTQGWNSKYPVVYGSPETVKGKTFLVRENTSSFYTLMTWVRALGLDFKDVNYKDVLPSEAVQAMFTGDADGLVIWSPNSYDAVRLGYAHVANAEDIHAFVPVVFCTHTDYAKAHTDELAKLIAIYLKACNEQKSNLKGMVTAYRDFLKIQTGRDYDEDFCKFDLLRHRVFTLDEQLDYFKEINGKSKMYELRGQILELFRASAAELNRTEIYQEKDYPASATDVYLKAAQKYLK